MSKQLSEKSLTYYLECPMRSATSMPEAPIFMCAEKTAKWLASERLDFRLPTVHDTLAYFETHWKETEYFKTRDNTPREEYERTVVQSARACRRLPDVFWRCEVLSSVSRYELQVGEMVVTGEYAVLRSSRPKKHAFALYLRDQGVRIKPLVPDIVSFARYLDLSNRLRNGASREWKVQDISVLHYWVLKDLSLNHISDRMAATNMLLGAAGAVGSNPFPIPGDHCLYCPARACQQQPPLQRKIEGDVVLDV